METIDDEVTDRTLGFIEAAHKEGKPFFVWRNSTHMHFRTHLRKSAEGKSGQGFYNDAMVEHDEYIGKLLGSSTSSASPTTRSFSIRPTTGRTSTRGRMPASRRSAARRTRIGRVHSACRRSFAGRPRFPAAGS
jgi:hypothetical protein